MSKFEYAKRLKRMLNKECEITQQETKIARKSAKYYEIIAKLRTKFTNNEHELYKLRTEMDELMQYNDKLEQFIRAEEERVNERLQEVERRKKEYHEAEQKQIEETNLKLARMGFIRKLKLATKTYFNMNALPHRFQGVQVCDGESGSVWKPFDVDGKQWVQFLEKHLHFFEKYELDKNDNRMQGIE